MPKSIHFICRQRTGLDCIGGTTYTSGLWGIGTQAAEQLVGGMVYFHESKSQPSYFGDGLLHGGAQMPTTIPIMLEI